MRAIVCGGRNYDDLDHLSKALTALGVTEVIHGGASGADTLAGAWALKNNVPCQIFPADWERLGRAAGPARNAKMLVDGEPDIVIAFPGGRGTANMISTAKFDCVVVVEVK